MLPFRADGARHGLRLFVGKRRAADVVVSAADLYQVKNAEGPNGGDRSAPAVAKRKERAEESRQTWAELRHLEMLLRLRRHW
jgi:hypothetical protein